MRNDDKEQGDDIKECVYFILTRTLASTQTHSEQCGYTVEQQCSLFKSIKPLFANKQLILVVNKIDVQPWETLEQEKKKMIEGLSESANCSMMLMSNVTEEGVMDVKSAACDKVRKEMSSERTRISSQKKLALRMFTLN